MAPIHEFITSTWELYETPIAYYRAGDPKPLLKAFEAAECTVTEHPFGYRSVHYVVRSRPDKNVHLAEIQVRTIFEEGWSEIDHGIRYPRVSDDPYLAEFLTIFNRLAGSADEMGTFIKGLSSELRSRAQQIVAMGTELQQAVSQLEISKEEKRKLEQRVESLQKAAQERAALPSSALNLLNYGPGLMDGGIIRNFPHESGGPGGIGEIFGGFVNSTRIVQKTCLLCGKNFLDDSGYLSMSVPGDICANCRGGGVLR